MINSSAISAKDSLIENSVSMCWAHMLEALSCNLHTLVPDSSMKFKWWKKISTLIICVSDKWMSQQNFTAQKVIYLSEILCVCMERSDFFFSLALR